MTASSGVEDDPGRSDEQVARVVITAYAVAAGFVVWPAFGVLVLGSAPEAFFVLVALATVAVVLRSPARFSALIASVGPLDLVLLALAGATAGRAVVAGEGGEAVAALYLAGVAGLVRVLLVPLDEPRRLAVVLDAVVIATVVHGGLVVGLWLIDVVFGVDPLETLRPSLPYPFLTGVPRGQGLAATPTMAAASLTAGWAVLAARSVVRWARAEVAGLVVVSVALALTMSKSLGGVVVVGLVVVALARPAHRRTATIAAGVAAAATIVLTHVTVHRSGSVPFDEEDWSELLPGPDRLLVVGDVQLSATAYLKLKIAGLRVGAEDPLVGVGPGGFADAAAGLTGARSDDPDWTGFDPHSTLTGTFAELGVVGVTLLAVSVVLVVRTCRDVLARTAGGGRARADRIGLVAALVGVAVEAVSTDVLHLRGLWILLGLVAALAGPQPVRATTASSAST